MRGEVEIYFGGPASVLMIAAQSSKFFWKLCEEIFLEAVRLLELFIYMVKHTWTIQRIALTSGEQLYTDECLTGKKKKPFYLEKIFWI